MRENQKTLFIERFYFFNKRGMLIRYIQDFKLNFEVDQSFLPKTIADIEKKTTEEWFDIFQKLDNAKATVTPKQIKIDIYYDESKGGEMNIANFEFVQNTTNQLFVLRIFYVFQILLFLPQDQSKKTLPYFDLAREYLQILIKSSEKAPLSQQMNVETYIFQNILDEFELVFRIAAMKSVRESASLLMHLSNQMHCFLRDVVRYVDFRYTWKK